jgi:hypothetical protein
MKTRHVIGLVLAGMVLAGCSDRKPNYPDRPEKPVTASVTLSVPGMT